MPLFIPARRVLFVPVAEPPAGGGQVISIKIAKLVLPLLWAKQGKVTRRDFMRNTGVTMLGIR